MHISARKSSRLGQMRATRHPPALANDGLGWEGAGLREAERGLAVFRGVRITGQ